MGDLFRHQEEVTSGTPSSCCGSGDWWRMSVRNDFSLDMETNLAKEMNELSFQEREQVFEEIHGVSNCVEETPEFKAKSIEDFDRSVSQLFKRKRKALDRAIFLKPSIQTDEKFKLLFLRAELYDPAKAANRMARFFEQKLVLFGEDKLVKDITRDDVTEEEIELGLRVIGTLSQRDRSGRPVRVAFPNSVDFTTASLEGVLRGGWYQTMAILDEDEVASTKGICHVSYSLGSTFKPECIPYRAKLGWISRDVLNCLPLRISSFHYCYNNPAMKIALNALGQGIGKQIRIRMRTHFGSPIEIQYSLLTYGIDVSYRVRSNDEVTLDKSFFDHREQIEKQQQQKRLDEEAISGVILYPNKTDVLVGRGHFCASHTGNRRYHTLIEANLEVYNQCNNRFRKTAISTEVVKTIRESNGRFLSPTNGGWEVVDDIVAREKTAIAFRSCKKKTRS